MDEFKPEDDLRPDTSDRRPSRARRPATGPRFAVSRQHMMIGIGILVLLLLIIGIGSALKAPTKHETAQQATRDINLSGSSSLTTANNGVAGGTSDTNDNNGVGNAQTQQPQTISVPPISGTPTEAQPQPAQGGAGQRVDLPGNMADALSSQQGQVDAATQNMNTAVSSLPTAPATVMSGAAAREATRPVQSNAASTAQQHKTPAKTAATKSAAAKPATSSKSSSTSTTVYTPSTSGKSGVVSGSAGSLKTAPGSHYTLQLSSASRSDTLNAFAKQQNLQHFMVYETKRDGKPWYVLVSGNYASSAEAKRAIATLPADVQAKKPWVRPVHQVQQDLKK
ncbi:DamX protein [Serratia fonticola]|uniref:Cell division protein DamX n=1 Tax=Serratia fonticola TaxID=47917 RepID=A0A542BGK5_SERFO|nr:SPOR domain-containing protein [Serratia fonticola]TQI77708.1 DamX protein [Serratia fonticola]TQI95298.1 DamX protein [Serratia fonticola]TVZ69793.1 DamX protein [Serratia fonticola]